VTRVTDDPAVVIERDTAVVAVELGAEEREARRIGRHGVPQSHPAAVIENAALRARLCVPVTGLAAESQCACRWRGRFDLL